MINFVNNPATFDGLRLEEQQVLVKWCKESFEKTVKVNLKCTSYGLKHIFSKKYFYVTNGNFKAAMIEAGYSHTEGLNWNFNISRESVRKASRISNEKSDRK